MKSTRSGRSDKGNYLQEAKRVFLEGSRFTSPVDAVEAGERTISDWCDTLALIRSRHGYSELPTVQSEEQLTARATHD